MTLSSGVWKITYTDDYIEGECDGYWRLTSTSKNRFKVEQQLEDGTFEHCMGDHELRWNAHTKQWYMYTFMSIVRVVKYSKIE